LKAKKQLGQHFLTDLNVITDIIDLIKHECDSDTPLIEVGPGKGVLTKELDAHYSEFKAIEFDRDMISILNEELPNLDLIQNDFLKVPIDSLSDKELNIVGNFPYNISTEIIFKILDHVDKVKCMVGMFQKEVAERICAGPKGRVNGIISIRAQAHYHAEKIFDIPPDAFSPPPKVQSSMIVLRRREDYEIDCNVKTFSQVIRMAYGQRRKKMRNTLKSLLGESDHPLLQKRPEELSVQEFIILSKIAESHK
jgi:16S rRNA (adenine1518-N6/adenine1519-N6)-dimethyltransferase